MNCNCHCTGKCKLLGGLEQKIMDTLWASPVPLKPSEVLHKLDRKYAYTTVMTVLKRMSDKKILKRQAQGRVFFYQPTQDKKSFATACLDDLFQRLFLSYGELTVDSFLSVAKKSKISTRKLSS